MFIYHTGELLYDFMTTTVGDICKEQFANRHSPTDTESVEEFCNSPLFFYLFILVFVCMMGPFVILDVSEIVKCLRCWILLTNPSTLPRIIVDVGDHTLPIRAVHYQPRIS